MTILASLTALIWSLSVDGGVLIADQAQQFVAIARNAVLVTRWEAQLRPEVVADLTVTQPAVDLLPANDPIVVAEPGNPAEEMAGDDDDANDVPIPQAIDPNIGPPQPAEPGDVAEVVEAADAAAASSAQAARAEAALRQLWHRTTTLAGQLTVRVPAFLSRAGIIPVSTAQRLGNHAVLPH